MTFSQLFMVMAFFLLIMCVGASLKTAYDAESFKACIAAGMEWRDGDCVK